MALDDTTGMIQRGFEMSGIQRILNCNGVEIEKKDLEEGRLYTLREGQFDIGARYLGDSRFKYLGV